MEVNTRKRTSLSCEDDNHPHKGHTDVIRAWKLVRFYEETNVSGEKKKFPSYKTLLPVDSPNEISYGKRVISPYV
jgi:hypothetical protein